MPKVHFVKKAQKDNSVVKKGESYYWWQHAFGSKQFSKTKPKPSQLTQSGFLNQLYSLQEQLDEGMFSSFDDLESDKDSLISELQNLLDECQEKLDNMPEHLQDTSPAGSILQERIDALENAISDIESIDVFEEPENWSDEFYDDWNEQTDKEKEEDINEWKNEKIIEFVDQIRDVFPQL